MISDILADAMEEIKKYLAEPTYEKVYEGEIRKEINELLLEMNRIRAILDCPSKVNKTEKGELQ